MLLRIVILLVLVAAAPVGQAATTVFEKPSAFLQATNGGKMPGARVLTLTAAHQARLKRFLGRELRPARFRYWVAGKRMVMILESIGKTEEITTGIVVSGGKIEQVKVLIYRESVGSEVRRTAFTNQFKGASLSSSGQLSKRVNNIAGATLSVRALTRMAKAALYLESIRR